MVNVNKRTAKNIANKQMSYKQLTNTHNNVKILYV